MTVASPTSTLPVEVADNGRQQPQGCVEGLCRRGNSQRGGSAGGRK